MKEITIKIIGCPMPEELEEFKKRLTMCSKFSFDSDTMVLEYTYMEKE